VGATWQLRPCFHDAERATSSANNEMLRLRDGRPSDRQDHADCCSLVYCTFRLNPAAVQLNDMLYNRQTETSSAEFAATGSIDPIKSLEDAGQISRGDTDPAICDRERDLRVARDHADYNGAAEVRIFHSVIEQGVHDFLQAHLVGAN
jgi:hypothetical protein